MGALRRNLFVPMPQIWDVKAYNGRLFDARLALSEEKPHYRKGEPESELFGDDRATLSPPPLGAVRVRQADHEEVRCVSVGRY